MYNIGEHSDGTASVGLNIMHYALCIMHTYCHRCMEHCLLVSFWLGRLSWRLLVSFWLGRLWGASFGEFLVRSSLPS